MTGPREHFLNGDFDLGLRPGWSGPGDGERSRQVRELTLQWLLLGVGGDSVLVSEPVPDDFLDSLERAGLERPRVSLWPDLRRSARLAPFGWGTQARDLAGRYDEVADHPPLPVVRRVNGRGFSATIEREVLGDDMAVGPIRSLAVLEEELHRQPDRPLGWVVKSEHGNAGLGNRRLRSRVLSEADRRTVAGLLAAADAVVLEPWLERLADLCTTFELEVDGSVRSLHVHEVVNTAEGAFLGALFGGVAGNVERRWEELERVAGDVARELCREGYHGPVCLDSFVFREGPEQRLRALADLNARSHVSAPALDLWRRWGGERVLYWRFFNTRKLRLPDDRSEMSSLLGDAAWRPQQRRGALLTSPPRLHRAGRPRRAVKTSMLLAGSSRREVLDLEGRVREILER
jgi:hypothetical protein